MTQDNATIVRRFAEEAITQGDIKSAAQLRVGGCRRAGPLSSQGLDWRV